MSPHKPSLAIAIGIPHHKEGEESEPEMHDGEEGEDHDADKKEAAEALIKAIKEGDADAVNVALETHYHLCEADKEAEEPEEGEEGEEEEGEDAA